MNVATMQSIITIPKAFEASMQIVTTKVIEGSQYSTTRTIRQNKC